MKNETPTELKEQSIFVNWCREKGHKVCATAQSTYTESWKAINQNRMLGVVKGLPDLIVIVNKKYRLDDKPKLLFIEMKRQGGGRISKEQEDWLREINKCDGIAGNVCAGAEKAKFFVQSYMEVEPQIDNSFINSLK